MKIENWEKKIWKIGSFVEIAILQKYKFWKNFSFAKFTQL